MTTTKDRCDQFAAGTTALQDNLTVAGADGVFDLALTNGLLAVVAAAIHGHAASAVTAKLPSASMLLADLAKKFGKDGAGVVLVPTGENVFDFGPTGLVDLGYERMVAVNVGLLADALVRTQAARHGRGPTGLLTDADVDALAVLDEHPALSVLSDFRREQYWARGSEEDAKEFDRAIQVFQLLGEDDVASRVAAAKANHGPGVQDHDLQFCPVCGNRTLVASGQDSWGYGTVAATCPVCSFEQSEHAAEVLNLDLEWEMRWADD